MRVGDEVWVYGKFKGKVLEVRLGITRYVGCEDDYLIEFQTLESNEPSWNYKQRNYYRLQDLIPVDFLFS